MELVSSPVSILLLTVPVKWILQLIHHFALCRAADGLHQQHLALPAVFRPCGIVGLFGQKGNCASRAHSSPYLRELLSISFLTIPFMGHSNFQLKTYFYVRPGVEDALYQPSTYIAGLLCNVCKSTCSCVLFRKLGCISILPHLLCLYSDMSHPGARGAM